MDEFNIITGNVIGSQWLTTKKLVIGGMPQTLSSPDLRVLIQKFDVPHLRIDIYTSNAQSYSFQEEIIWCSWIIIGYGSCIYFISTIDNSHKIVEFTDYFGHLYPHEDYLLAASGSEILKIDQDAKIVWKCEHLGIDGVLVEDVLDNVIIGQGEWDPPGGWQPFKLNLETGKILQNSVEMNYED